MTQPQEKIIRHCIQKICGLQKIQLNSLTFERHTLGEERKREAVEKLQTKTYRHTLNEFISCRFAIKRIGKLLTMHWFTISTNRAVPPAPFPNEKIWIFFTLLPNRLHLELGRILISGRLNQKCWQSFFHAPDQEYR